MNKIQPHAFLMPVCAWRRKERKREKHLLRKELRTVRRCKKGRAFFSRSVQEAMNNQGKQRRARGHTYYLYIYTYPACKYTARENKNFDYRSHRVGGIERQCTGGEVRLATRVCWKNGVTTSGRIFTSSVIFGAPIPSFDNHTQLFRDARKPEQLLLITPQVKVSSDRYTHTHTIVNGDMQVMSHLARTSECRGTTKRRTCSSRLVNIGPFALASFLSFLYENLSLSVNGRSCGAASRGGLRVV